MEIKKIGMTAYEGGLTLLTIAVDGDRSAIAELVRKAKDKPYKLEIKKAIKNRSLDANSYYWVLNEKLSKVLGLSRDELHKKLLAEYGSLKVKPDGKPIVFSLRSDIDVSLVPCYTHPIGSGNINGQNYTHYAVLKGSSELTSEEFSHFLNGVISDCKDQGIEVATPEELKRIMEVTNAYCDRNRSQNQEEFAADIQEQIEWSSLDRAECVTKEVRN